LKHTGKLTIQVLAMPADTNPNGDVFGGWLLSQMDIAGGVFCRKVARGRVVTVAMNSIEFNQPVFVGDTLSCYVELIKTGRTSMTVRIEACAHRAEIKNSENKVTEGMFTYVKIDENRKPIPIKKSQLV